MLIFSLVLFSTLGCINNNKPYVISKEDSLYKASFKKHDGALVIPPRGKYGRNTFLIDSNSSVYYYSFQEPSIGKGVSDDREPDTIGLMPNHIFKIPAGMERAFFKKNVLDQESKLGWKSIIVASFKDSVTNDFVQYLLKMSKDEPKKISFRIRLALPEEREVLRYKLNGEHYGPFIK